MSILVDTNLLTRSVQPDSPQFVAATNALLELNRRREQPCVVPQVIYEFWTVCTRPAGENGLGLDTAGARAQQAKALQLFTLLPDTPAVFPNWQRLVVQYDVKGRAAHDARLVAAMLVHGLDRIITFNGSDFSRYVEIKVVPPTSLLSAP